MEHVTVECDLANRSKEPHTTYLGSLKLISSAYPKYNFGTNLEFKKIEGHFVTTIKYNGKDADVTDEYNTMVLTLNFAKREEDPIHHVLSRTTASVSLRRPKGQIDLKFKIMYDYDMHLLFELYFLKNIIYRHEEKFNKGIEHNFYCALGYAPQKEAKAVFSLLRGSRSQLIIDATMNITIPDFDSCAASIKILEKKRNDYNVRSLIKVQIRKETYSIPVSDKYPWSLVFWSFHQYTGSLSRQKLQRENIPPLEIIGDESIV